MAKTVAYLVLLGLVGPLLLPLCAAQGEKGLEGGGIGGTICMWLANDSENTELTNHRHSIIPATGFI